MFKYKKSILIVGVCLVLSAAVLFNYLTLNAYSENDTTENTENFYTLPQNASYQKELEEALCDIFEKDRLEKGYTEGILNEDLCYNASICAPEIYKFGAGNHRSYISKDDYRKIDYLYSPLEISVKITLDECPDQHTLQEYAQFIWEESKKCLLFTNKYMNHYGVSVYGKGNEIGVSWYFGNLYSKKI